MDDLVAEFLTETNESLDELDTDIIVLEQNPNDKNLLSKIFRLMHTIKGTCGFLGLPRLEKVAHHAENVLGKFRDGELEVTPDYVTLILESIDRIKLIVRALEETGSEPEGDNKDLIQKLDDVYEGRTSSGGGNNSAPAAPVEEKKLDVVLGAESGLSAAELAALEKAFAEAEGPAMAAPPPPPPPPPPQAQAAAAMQADGDGPGRDASGAPAQTLRVNVDVLENLMTMVSELVLTRNQLLQISRAQGDNDFLAPLQRLNHVVSELQEGVMKTRMQPIGNAWSKLPRIIRDLAMELGKKIDLEMNGQETELDRQVLELIKDPLTHMVRNSADHGIEMPADRIKAGKNEMGKVILNAFHEGGHIIIEIKDDGKGLSSERIKNKIIEKGLATAEEVAQMSTQQIQQYIFDAGFSTAEKVTSVSGRGVGMDVVRTNIEKIGGSIELKSTEGKGSAFIIKIPLTLAIVSALIVESKGEKFAIPQLSVRELVMTSSKSENRIEMIKGTPVFRLRDRLLPLVFLSEILKLPEQNSAGRDGEGSKSSSVKNQYIVVTQVGSYEFGIVVDRVFDTEEIVVKPVATLLKGLDLFSGNTILGDGKVIMILDPNGIAKATGEIKASDDMAAAADAHMDSMGREKTSLLLFSAYDQAPKAVPLSLVARLEQIKMKDVEYSGGQMMVQYRNELMPLKPFNPSMTLENEKEKPVLVFTDKDKSLGIVVDKIIDIKEEYIDVQIGSENPGLMGSAIIDGHATDIVDVVHFLNSAHKAWFKDHEDVPYEGRRPNGSGIKKVLLVDDSPFFRNMLTPILNVAGYNVTSLESPIEALKRCEKGERYDIIISDIEMPDMNGFEFAEKLKDNSNWQNTPLVALSSHTTPEDMERGMQVGFEKYVAKFDRDTLLSTISQTLLEQRDKAA